MAIHWGAAGVVALGVMIFSPKARQYEGKLLEELATAQMRKEQAEEAQRRKAAMSDIIDRLEFSAPPTLSTPIAPALTTAVEPDARWRDVIVPPAVVLVLGKRRSGKSALALRLLELFRYRLTPYVVSAPAQAGKLLPDWMGTVPNLEDLPPDSIALVDEAYIHFHARRSMAQDSKAMSQALNLSKQ